MKTLIIHPTDPTTDFLKPIYENNGIENMTVINQPDYPSFKLKQLMIESDRIIMLGHGTPQGLIGKGRFIIDSSYVYLLRIKECIGIWCHCNQFFEKYNIKGLCSSMFISEIEESEYYNIISNINDITTSNNNFTNHLKHNINLKNIKYIYENVINSYSLLSESNNVIKFNVNGIKYY